MQTDIKLWLISSCALGVAALTASSSVLAARNVSGGSGHAAYQSDAACFTNPLYDTIPNRCSVPKLWEVPLPYETNGNHQGSFCFSGPGPDVYAGGYSSCALYGMNQDETWYWSSGLTTGGPVGGCGGGGNIINPTWSPSPGYMFLQCTLNPGVAVAGINYTN